MTDININKELNQKLKNLYGRMADGFLAEYEKAFGDKAPCINEFGIADEESYDADNGIFVILKETNGWSDKDFRESLTYKDFVYSLIEKGNGINDGRKKAERVQMNMWYNLGRWIYAIMNPQKPTVEIAEMYNEALKSLGAAAYTNVNKVRGYEHSGKEFYKLAKTVPVLQTLKEEVEILKPKVILFCGTARILGDDFIGELKQNGCKVLEIWHPAARKSKLEMIEIVKKQMKED